MRRLEERFRLFTVERGVTMACVSLASAGLRRVTTSHGLWYGILIEGLLTGLSIEGRFRGGQKLCVLSLPFFYMDICSDVKLF